MTMLFLFDLTLTELSSKTGKGIEERLLIFHFWGAKAYLTIQLCFSFGSAL